MKCARCGGSMVRGADGPECLLCGQSASPAADDPERLAALVAERAAEANRRTHILKVECSHCGGLYATAGLHSHQQRCLRALM